MLEFMWDIHHRKSIAFTILKTATPIQCGQAGTAVSDAAIARWPCKFHIANPPSRLMWTQPEEHGPITRNKSRVDWAFATSFEMSLQAMLRTDRQRFGSSVSEKLDDMLSRIEFMVLSIIIYENLYSQRIDKFLSKVQRFLMEGQKDIES